MCLRNSEEADVLEQSEREGGLGDEVGQTMGPGPVGPCVHSNDCGATGRLSEKVRHDLMQVLAESLWLQ